MKDEEVRGGATPRRPKAQGNAHRRGQKSEAVRPRVVRRRKGMRTEEVRGNK